jgi:hypothetical protein
MSSRESPEPPLLDWAEAGAGLEHVSGDAAVVQPFAGGVLVAVLDGLGHGPEAAAASRAATRILAAHAGEPIAALVTRCHDALRGTRGTVLSLASFDARAATMTWGGVGNVEGVLVRGDAARPGREVLTPRGGVVGYVLTPVRTAVLPVRPGDTLLLATDGIRGGFTDGVDLSRRPREVADEILARHARGSDDALVLVARYLGP